MLLSIHVLIGNAMNHNSGFLRIVRDSRMKQTITMDRWFDIENARTCCIPLFLAFSLVWGDTVGSLEDNLYGL